MIAEADLYKEWVPFMEDSREMVGSGYRKIVYIKIGLPWPFEARDAVRETPLFHLRHNSIFLAFLSSCCTHTTCQCCYGYTVDRLAEEGSILIVMRDSVADDPLQLPKSMPPQPKTVRMMFHLGGLMLRPLGVRHSHIHVYLTRSRKNAQLAHLLSYVLSSCLLH